MFNWLKLRGNRAKKFGAVVVVGVVVTFALDDVMMLMFMRGDDEAWKCFVLVLDLSMECVFMWIEWLWFDGINFDNNEQGKGLLSFFVAWN
jgi:hypothetical protein